LPLSDPLTDTQIRKFLPFQKEWKKTKKDLDILIMTKKDLDILIMTNKSLFET